MPLRPDARKVLGRNLSVQQRSGVAPAPAMRP